MRCPHCKNQVLQKSGAKTRLRIEGPVVFTEDGATAKCYWCKRQVELPIEIKAGTPLAAERFIIQKN